MFEYPVQAKCWSGGQISLGTGNIHGPEGQYTGRPPWNAGISNLPGSRRASRYIEDNRHYSGTTTYRTLSRLIYDRSPTMQTGVSAGDISCSLVPISRRERASTMLIRPDLHIEKSQCLSENIKVRTWTSDANPPRLSQTTTHAFHVVLAIVPSNTALYVLLALSTASFVSVFSGSLTPCPTRGQNLRLCHLTTLDPSHKRWAWICS